MEPKHKEQFLYNITPQTIKKYERNGLYFSKPRLVAIYETDYGKIIPPKKILYFKNPRLSEYPIDLNAGFDTYIRRLTPFWSINVILKYGMSLAEEKDAFNGSVNSVEKTKVFARRGTLIYIMELFYAKKYESSVRVSRYNGNIYMLKEDTRDYLSALTPKDTHHGHLQSLLFTESPNGLPKTNEPYDSNKQVAAVHRSSLGEFDMIYSGEMPGIKANEKIKDLDDINALNKCRFVFAKQMWKTLKNNHNKYLNYWLQSYLANVQDIYIAYKDNAGIVEEPIEYKLVSELPKNRYWKPSVCISFLHNFLQHVEKLMSKVNDPNTVYVFRYNPEERSFNYEIYEGKTEHSFISEEYIEHCNKVSV